MNSVYSPKNFRLHKIKEKIVNKEYDIYICYDRTTGKELAKPVYEALAKRGYSVFVDVLPEQEGEYGEQNNEIIKNCTDFIFIMTNGVLDKCIYSDNYVRKEIVRAIEMNRNIIPIQHKSFVEPTDMPKKIADIMKYQRIFTEKMTFGSMIDKLCLYLQSEPDENGTDMTDPDMIFSDEPKPYVFISYNTQSIEKANLVRKLLTEKGISCWMAPYSIPAGEEYIMVINDAIDNCACLLLILTDAAQNSKYVEREVWLALEDNKTIIPMQIDNMTLGSSLKFIIGNLQIIEVDEINKNSESFNKVVKAIENKVKIR